MLQQRRARLFVLPFGAAPARVSVIGAFRPVDIAFAGDYFGRARLPLRVLVSYTREGLIILHYSGLKFVNISSA